MLHYTPAVLRYCSSAVLRYCSGAVLHYTTAVLHYGSSAYSLTQLLLQLSASQQSNCQPPGYALMLC